MPPKTRACKAQTKLINENAGVSAKTKLKAEFNVSKEVRKPLADKTNSASDNNTSDEVTKKKVKKVATTKRQSLKNDIPPAKNKPKNDIPPAKNKPKVAKVSDKDKVRPRRDRRLPTRYVENQVLVNLSNSKENTSITTVKQSIIKSHQDNKKSPEKRDLSVLSPFKSPSDNVDNSLLINRPKRVSRLPSRFEDHSISPNKFIPVQPCHASTPIVQNRHKAGAVKNKATEIQSSAKKDTLKPVKKVQTLTKDTTVSKSDTNNNAKRTRSAANKLNIVKDNPQTKKRLIEKVNNNLSKNSSLFRILGEKPNRKSSRNVDVYEFTFDPDKEPTPQKKKRNPPKKKATVKKPKAVIFKNNYNKNIAKALADLKSKITGGKASEARTGNDVNEDVQETDKQVNGDGNIIQNYENNKPSSSGTSYKPANADNYASIRIEDIAADFNESLHLDDHHNIDYSPVNSPARSDVCPDNPVPDETVPRPTNTSTDPLNLQENLSFFDEQPVASSSINVSVRHPLASPWRVEFNALPIKWQANTYMKPNMTPALESSFINSDESRKKHVYTNLIPQTNDSMDFLENDAPKLKQTSIIDFMREVAEKSANKKKKNAAKTPNHYVFDDVLSTANQENGHNLSEVSASSNSATDNCQPQPIEIISDNIENLSNSKENANAKESRKRKNEDEENTVPAKSPKRNTLFGFDDSEEVDQENVSPKKGGGRRRQMRATRSRAVLQELNPAGPMRAVIPLAPKINSNVVNKLYNELKSAEAPVVPDIEIMHKPDATNVNDTTWQEDSISVHLFEDVEMVVKPPRKSYGKSKKVAFRPRSSSSETEDTVAAKQVSSDDEDLSDLSFHIPSEKPKKTAKKKQTKKNKVNKKEQEEVEAWAAGFNSMCEDVEEFDLLVE